MPVAWSFFSNTKKNNFPHLLSLETNWFQETFEAYIQITLVSDTLCKLWCKLWCIDHFWSTCPSWPSHTPVYLIYLLVSWSLWKQTFACFFLCLFLPLLVSSFTCLFLCLFLTLLVSYFACFFLCLFISQLVCSLACWFLSLLIP